MYLHRGLWVPSEPSVILVGKLRHVRCWLGFSRGRMHASPSHAVTPFYPAAFRCLLGF